MILKNCDPVNIQLTVAIVQMTIKAYVIDFICEMICNLAVMFIKSEPVSDVIRKAFGWCYFSSHVMLDITLIDITQFIYQRKILEKILQYFKLLKGVLIYIIFVAISVIIVK